MGILALVSGVTQDVAHALVLQACPIMVKPPTAVVMRTVVERLSGTIPAKSCRHESIAAGCAL